MNRVTRFMRIAAVVLICAVGAQAGVTIETVLVGNAGNAADTRYETPGYGGVQYVYRIGKFEITAGQYTEFLNAVAKADTYGLYNTAMADPSSSSWGCNIQRSGSPGSYEYIVGAEWANRPANYISWGDAARFCNWLHNRQPTGAQDPSTTEDGSYLLNGATSDAALLAIVRKADPTYVIPSEDEWYKAAYHKNDGTTDDYWDCPTRSDTAPTPEAPPGTDLTNGSANYCISFGVPVDPIHGRTDVGAYDAKPSDSAYQTFDQGGNVFEWNEAVTGSDRGVRGGSFAQNHAYYLCAPTRFHWEPTREDDTTGFRVAIFADCNANDIPDECDLNCGATIGMTGGSCSVVYPGCGTSTDENGDGVLDDCAPDIPTVSEWGVVAMAALMLAAGAVVVSRRRAVG
ncbi:MAG: IPTL-CTERM sorting domain-containing protein [Planctomycetota bacterium]